MKERAQAPKKLPGWVWGGLIGCAIIMSWMGWNSRAANQALVLSFGGENNLRCVREAQRVYATRLGPSPEVEHPGQFDQFVAIAEPIEVSRELGRRFQELLTSSSSYRHDVAPACVPIYGYRLRFVCDKAAVEAFVCLHCSLIEFVIDGESVGGGFFAPAERAVREMSKQLFPGDVAIEQAAQ